jgi:hypothetical protein
MEPRGIVLAKRAQKNSAAVGLQAWQLPPAGLARGRCHSGIVPVVLVYRLNELDGVTP